jgi:hypothetical protein
MSAPPDSRLARAAHGGSATSTRRMQSDRDAALAEQVALISQLAYRNSAYEEGTTYQAATIDVLHAMSGSPGDPQPVSDLISVRARSSSARSRPLGRNYFLTCVKRLTQEYALAAQG